LFLFFLKVNISIQEHLDTSDAEIIMEKTASLPGREDQVQLSDTQKGITNINMY